MVKLPKRFSVGERIFAKVRGYPPWPAKIENITDPGTKNAKYHVVFFGTKEIGTCKVEDLYNYAENKEKFTKTVRRKFFQEGLDELERDLRAYPEPQPTAAASSNSLDDSIASSSGSNNNAMDVSESLAAAATDYASERHDASSIEQPSLGENELDVQEQQLALQPAGELVIDEGEQRKKAAKRKSQMPAAGTPDVPDAKKKRGRKSIAAPSYPESGSGARQSQPPPQQQQQPDASVVGDTTLDPDDPDKKVSRSGRKIKPKRFHDGIDAEVSIDASRTDTPIRNRAKSKTDDHNDINDTPASLKKKANAGNDRRSQHAKEEEDSESQHKLKTLRIESQILFLDTQIRSSLNLEKANTDECLEAIEQLEQLPITPLMLKKHSHIVETVKRLRRYVGNLKDWKLSEEEIIIFKQKADLIQKKAAIIYIKFKALFDVGSSEGFWDYFLEQVKQLKEVTEKMSQEEFYSLIVDPTDELDKSMEESNDEASIAKDTTVDAVSNKIAAATIESN